MRGSSPGKMDEGRERELGGRVQAKKRTKLGGRDFRGEGCRQDWRIDMQRDRRIESDGKERTEKSPYSTGKRGKF